MERTVTLEQIKDRSISDLLHDVARQHEGLRVVLDTGETISLEAIGPEMSGVGGEPPELQPLPTFKGYVPPANWKELIYDVEH